MSRRILEEHQTVQTVVIEDDSVVEVERGFPEELKKLLQKFY